MATGVIGSALNFNREEREVREENKGLTGIRSDLFLPSRPSRPRGSDSTLPPILATTVGECFAEGSPMKTPLQHFSSRRLGTWQGEWEFLQRSLARDPDALQVWWWKLRMRVLAFVIARYGADPAVRDRDHAPEPREIASDVTFGERHTIEPRPRSALGAHLESMAKTNDFSGPRSLPDDHPSGSNFGIRFFHAIVLGVSLGMLVYLMISIGPAAFFLGLSNSIHDWLMRQ
jgi:hypothetical protein